MPKNSKQNILERRARILDLLREKEFCTVSYLAEALGTSEVTIRRELEALAAQDKVSRFHGGAGLRKELLPNFDAEQNFLAMQEEKEAIAQAAAKYISAGDTVFLNSSSTAGKLIPYLTAGSVTVATNNCHTLSSRFPAGLSLLMIGGETTVNDYKLSNVGEYALNMINSIISNVTVIGLSGINAAFGLTTKDRRDSPLNAAMLHNCSGKKIAVADSRKVGITHNYKFADITDIDILITDSGADTAALDAIRAAGVTVIIAK